MKSFQLFNKELNEDVFKKFPDYESRKKHLHRLIDKRGDKTSNLSKAEQKEYISLTDWWDQNGKD